VTLGLFRACPLQKAFGQSADFRVTHRT
jgi:hypothetical protein